MATPISSLYTAADGDILELQTVAYETCSLIVQKQQYPIGQDEESDKFYIQIRNHEGLKNGGDYGVVKILLDVGEYGDVFPIESPSQGFRITLISETAAPEKYVFSIDFIDLTCFRNALFQGMQDVETEELRQINDNPYKPWADFNSDHREWEFLRRLASMNLLCWENIPDEPKIEDYS